MVFPEMVLGNSKRVNFAGGCHVGRTIARTPAIVKVK